MGKLVAAAVVAGAVLVGVSPAFAEEIVGPLGSITETSVTVGGKVFFTSGATQKPREFLENGQNVKVTFTTTNGVNRASKIELVK
ncbi:MAG: DUF5666 domain-containing protein [Bauldia sp.]